MCVVPQVFDYDFGLQDDFMGSAYLHLESLEQQRYVGRVSLSFNVKKTSAILGSLLEVGFFFSFLVVFQLVFLSNVLTFSPQVFACFGHQEHRTHVLSRPTGRYLLLCC